MRTVIPSAKFATRAESRARKRQGGARGAQKSLNSARFGPGLAVAHLAAMRFTTRTGARLGAVILALLASSAGPARADDDAGTPSLAATDFAFTLARVDASGATVALDADALASYFSAARCACPTSVVASLALSADAAASLGTHTVDAQLFVGADCDVPTAAACTSVGGTLTLSGAKATTTESVSTAAVFTAGGAAGCAAATSSTRLWAIVRLDGTRLASEPSLALTLGGAGPTPPTAVKAQTAESGLLVSWTPSADAVAGYQVLCSPGPAVASTARYDVCGAASPDGGAGPFATLEPALVCSDLVPAGTTSARVHGLDDGRTYDIAVVAVGLDGTPSAPSVSAQGTPGPTFGFEDVYRKEGGTAQAGCAVGGGGGPAAGAVALAALALVLARRRRARLGALLVGGGLALLAPRSARAQLASPVLEGPGDAAPAAASPRAWNLELRLAPYRPNVDDEFAARGSVDRPFAEVFGSSRRLMLAGELDRQLSHRGGTWALGVGAGYYHATAPALEADLKSPSGDETTLRLIPLSTSLVYRADTLRERFGSPLVPYAKLGLDCTLWRMSDTSKASIDGRTFGWHAAAGVTLDLGILDPEGARTMDRESGVNQTAIFFEVARYALDNFGSSSALHVGDTTWFAGLMLEL
jgi:MYXO-CTERM domain-containing protein